MASLHKTESGTAYIDLSWDELALYSHNYFPICDSCLKDLIGEDHVILIPILNEAFCPKCGKRKLTTIKNYPEDQPIAERRTKYYCKFFGLEAT